MSHASFKIDSQLDDILQSWATLAEKCLIAKGGKLSKWAYVRAYCDKLFYNGQFLFRSWREALELILVSVIIVIVN